MVVSHHQNVGQNHSLLIVAKFKYLETIATNQNCIHEEIKTTLRSWNARDHSVQSFVFPSPLQELKD
jgi:hypothetical protein